MKKQLAIIDYGSGNLRSVAKAFAHVAGNSADIKITGNPADIRTAGHLVLPGVGAFGDCIAGLNAIPGMRDAMEEAVFTREIPFLGICVGMQLLCDTGYENGRHEGLGWIKGTCIKLQSPMMSVGSDSDPLERGRSGGKGSNVTDLPPINNKLKIPHMGWNDLVLDRPQHPLLAGIENGAHAYFVHSYHVVLREASDQLAHVDHGGDVTAIIAKGNIMGTQFHPEKSQAAGLALLKNFLKCNG